jgi:sugar O-acyltransferase (sialic acid O-acetyltransferase NeuD family)
MSRVVIFGLKDLASLAHFYLREDSEHEVVAFTVDREFIRAEEFEGLPVVPFEEVEKTYPPSEYKLFIPMTQKKMGRLREEKYNEAKRKGYSLVSYVSSKATTFSNLEVGENCFILEDNTIQPFVVIGNNVVLWSGNHIGHHSEIGDHVFLTSHVVISGHVRIEPYSFFGVNATIRDGLVIAEGTLVGMGATVVKNTEPYGVYSSEGAKKRPDLRSDQMPGF